MAEGTGIEPVTLSGDALAGRFLVHSDAFRDEIWRRVKESNLHAVRRRFSGPGRYQFRYNPPSVAFSANSTIEMSENCSRGES